MAELFDNVFNKAGIYDTYFFTIKTVLKHPTLEVLEKEDNELYKRWSVLAQTKHYKNIAEDIKGTTIYEKHAPHYPEFSKIVAITSAKVYAEEGTLKRRLIKFADNDEFTVLSSFMDELYRISSDAVQSNPNYFPTLCGHNILGYDIPFLIKRFVYYRDKFETNKQIPLILKRSLNLKPWDSGIIDTVNVWKFNGYDKMPLMLIADFMGLKRTVDLMSLEDLSHIYWNLMQTEPDEALPFIALQSATQTNLVIQLMNELRLL